MPDNTKVILIINISCLYSIKYIKKTKNAYFSHYLIFYGFLCLLVYILKYIGRLIVRDCRVIDRDGDKDIWIDMDG